jgi:predicted deacylase
MQRLGKNIGSYFGETIDIRAVFRDIDAAAPAHGWTSETFYQSNEFKLTALRRPALSAGAGGRSPRIYLSSGMHGDEPAGPLAVRQLLQENKWPANLDLWVCPCLNPIGFTLNQRGNANGVDLNREYLKPVAAEVVAHIAWFERQPRFDLCLLLHEDWESHGFYLYEQNPDRQQSLAEAMVARVAAVCPVDRSEVIEGRAARDGIIRPNIDPYSRPDWPEAFYVITHKTRLSYTLEGPSDFPMSVRVAALVTAVSAALEQIAGPLNPK